MHPVPRGILRTLTLATWASSSALAQDTACVSGEDPAATESARASLQIESRKRGLHLDWQLVQLGDPCPSDQPVLALAQPDAATLHLTGEEPIVYALNPDDPTASRGLARQVIAALGTKPQASPAPVPMLAVDDPILLGEPPPSAELAPKPPDRWQLRAGLAWAVPEPDQTLAGPTVEVGHLLVQEHLGLGASGSWTWGTLPEERDLERLHGGEALAHARLGGQVGPVQMTAGLGLGVAWRSRGSVVFEETSDLSSEVRDEEEREPVEDNDRSIQDVIFEPRTAGLWSPEATVMLALGPTLEAGLSAAPRLYFGDRLEGIDLLRTTTTLRFLVGVRR